MRCRTISRSTNDSNNCTHSRKKKREADSKSCRGYQPKHTLIINDTTMLIEEIFQIINKIYRGIETLTSNEIAHIAAAEKL